MSVTAVIGKVSDSAKLKMYLDRVICSGSGILFPKDADQALACSHLLVLGGGDCNPELFGQKPWRSGESYDRKLDELELELIGSFCHEGKPVLGICRGMQMINVALGGTLYQDIKHDLGIDHPSSHGIRISESSGLFGKLDEVNSFHHQCLDLLGNTLCVTAVSDDGVAEMIESEKYPLLGVQWHPERMAGNAVFDYFYKEKLHR